MARKYELETIPIWDAFDQESECPLCILDEAAEQRYVEFFLGNSVMLPEMRVEVNKTGFCPDHFARLWNAAGNPHSLSLVTHTHLIDLMDGARKWESALRSGAPVSGKQTVKRVERYIEYLRGRERSCMICDRMDYTLRRYAFSIVYLWDKKDDFAQTLRDSKGFCYHHLPGLLQMAVDQLSGPKLARFAAEVAACGRRNMERMEAELLWYTQKFDYQNDGKPWGTSKDALQRALQKIAGKIFRGKRDRRS